MKKLLAITLLLFSATVFAVDFVIPEVQTKFDELDASISSINALADGKILIGNASGAATEVTMSGDVTVTRTGTASITSGSIVNADVNASAAIDFSKLAAVPAGYLIVGDVTNTGSPFAVSGDIGMSNTGVASISAGVVTEADLIAYSGDALHPQRVARATWDFAEHGGTQGAINLGVALPANALVHYVYYYVVTQVVDAGSGTGALSCEDAANLTGVADITGYSVGTVVDGSPQNTAATMVKDISAACNITWTIAGADASAGKIVFFVHYSIVE